MRMLLYICILALLPLAPVERLDVAELEPVQTVAVSISQQQILIETDTKNRGKGLTIREAIADLEENTPGVIYLDTAQYLLLTKEATQYSNDLKTYMRPDVRVSLWDGEGDVAAAAKYLDVRKDLPKLKNLGKPPEK